MTGRPTKANKTVVWLSDQAGPEPRYWFCFAGVVVASNLSAPELAPFAIEARTADDLGTGSKPNRPDHLTFSGAAYVASEDRQMTCHGQDRRYELAVEGLGRFQIDPGQQRVLHQSQGDQADNNLLWQAFLGPCLPLLLADIGLYFLHASAVGNQGLTAFAGPSGHGKSTFAGFLDHQGQNRRFADDLLPVRTIGESIHIDFPYPQLKLQDLGAGTHKNQQLNRLILLKPVTGGGDPALQNLTPAQALVAISANTVALKLFSRQQLGQHLAFARLFAERVECVEMEYRQELSQLPAMRAAIGPL